MSLRYLFLLALAVAVPAFSHSDGESPPDGILDCEHPPKNLAKALPKSLAAVATLVCTPSTQMITPKTGWSWRYPGSYFDRPSIPAYSAMESRGEASGRYFTSFKASELSVADARGLHEKFAKTLATYAEAKPPARLVKLVAGNDKGHSVDAYFGFRSDSEGWVAVCAPECAPEFFFLINRQ